MKKRKNERGFKVYKKLERSLLEAEPPKQHVTEYTLIKKSERKINWRGNVQFGNMPRDGRMKNDR